MLTHNCRERSGGFLGIRGPGREEGTGKIYVAICAGRDGVVKDDDSNSVNGEWAGTCFNDTVKDGFDAANVSCLVAVG